MITELMRKFYIWLYLKSQKELKELHMKEYHNDIKCTNCNTWMSISEIEYQHTYENMDPWGYSSQCGKCKHLSYWNLAAAPVALKCDKNGTPY